MAVLFISAELEEVLRLSHRVAVLRDRAAGRASSPTTATSTLSRLIETIASGAHERPVPERT